MKLLTAAILGAIAFVMPLVFGGRSGLWMSSRVRLGTIRPPLEGSPGLLFSMPVFGAATLIFRTFFNWHSR